MQHQELIVSSRLDRQSMPYLLRSRVAAYELYCYHAVRNVEMISWPCVIYAADSPISLLLSSCVVRSMRMRDVEHLPALA